MTRPASETGDLYRSLHEKAAQMRGALKAQVGGVRDTRISGGKSRNRVRANNCMRVALTLLRVGRALKGQGGGGRKRKDTWMSGIEVRR